MKPYKISLTLFNDICLESKISSCVTFYSNATYVIKINSSLHFLTFQSIQEVCQYKANTPSSSFTSVGVSNSGRIILGSSDDSTVHMWDVVGTHTGSLSGHDNRITQLSVAPGGFAVATSSWDNNVRIWGL